MIFVIFPAYNEEKVIRPPLLALAAAYRGREHEVRAVLVDDGSSDRTIEEANRAVQETGGRLSLTVLQHEVNRGLGAGLRTGIYWCLDQAKDDDILVTLDADNTHPPALIPTLVGRVREGYDLAIASRYRVGSEVHGVPGYRRALSDVGRLIFQGMFYFPGVRDYTCCFRAYSVPLLRRARLVYGDELCTARGFEAVMDILLKLRPLGVRAVEIPFNLDYGERVGQSKMKVMKTIRTTLALLGQRWLQGFTTLSKGRIRARLEAAEAAARAAGSARSPGRDSAVPAERIS